MMTRRETIDWWLLQFNLQIENFMSSPLGSAKDGMIDLMGQYRDAVKFGQVEPPRIYRRS